MVNDLIEKLTISSVDILDGIIREAGKDKVFTDAETMIIHLVKEKMNVYTSDYDKLIEQAKNSKESDKETLNELVHKQNEIFSKMLIDVHNQIKADGKIEVDELALYKTLSDEFAKLGRKNQELLNNN